MKKNPTVVKTLPCILSPAEVDDYARRSAATMAEFKQAEENKKLRTGQMTRQLKSLRSEVDHLAECATTGIERRAVDCHWKFYRSRGEAELIREDTYEVVSTREMTSEEMQVSLSFSVDVTTGPLSDADDE